MLTKPAPRRRLIQAHQACPEEPAIPWLGAMCLAPSEGLSLFCHRRHQRPRFSLLAFPA